MNTPVQCDVVLPELLDEKLLVRATAVLEHHVRHQTTPCASAAILNREGTVAKWVVGRHTYAADAKALGFGDLFDLASVTKVMATATLLGMFSERGDIDLDAPVYATIPEFRADARITPRALLAHCGGLPAHIHLYKRLIDRKEVVRAVCKMDLEYAPLSKSVYSDMGYILLGELLERRFSAPLNELFRDCIREPMGLYETVFGPGESAKPRIVPTERDLAWRGRLVHGEVHDENASVMRGVAPHAGLFATLDNVSRFAQMWLNEGVLDGKRFLGKDTVRMFRSRAMLDDDSTWALGWDTVSAEGSTSGQHFSSESYGILGFTGTSIWVDPAKEIAVVLLTNRVHPTRDNLGIRKLRPEFHDAAIEAVK